MLLHFSLFCLQQLHKYLSSVPEFNTLISLLPTSLMASDIQQLRIAPFSSPPMLAPGSDDQVAAASENGHTDTEQHRQG